MIHVNVRGLIIRKYDGKTQLLIQLRKRPGEPEVYELPGGRLNEYEKMTDGLKREIEEETGLRVVAICNEESSVVTKANDINSIFSVECMKPYAAYQTIEGPVDSFGVYFLCEAEGELLERGTIPQIFIGLTRKNFRESLRSINFQESICRRCYCF